MSDPRAEIYANELQACIDATVKMAEALTAEQQFLQAKSGGAHPAWLIGHLANTLDTVVNPWALNAERMLPKGFGRRFAPQFVGGDPITENKDDYPPWDDILAEYKKVGAACVDGIRKLTTAELDGGLRGNVPDQFKDFFGNTQATIASMIRHDSHHRGQMALLAALKD